jgi:eukaryotic-like serine/threonine-protein kinase
MVPLRVAKPTHSMMGAAEPPGGGDDDDARTVRPAERVYAGSILGGKYKLISEIGRGGMGAVWRAQHLGWDAPVALKIMNRDITARPEALARFEREVRLAAGLRSPHVVQVLDHGLDEATRTPYIAMELLEGESLARRLKQAGRISPAETFHVFSELVRALSRAHAAGIVHRDLKPDNVFLVKNDEESLTKVLDFGVAKWTAPDISESGLTRPGSVVGTPYYMSPEQIQGSREIDHRADLWALAAIACECLTGMRPFEAPDFAQLAVLLLGNSGRPLPSSLGPVPAGFDAWFLRATDPDIARRFQSAREMAQTLAPICDAAAPSSGSDAFPSPRAGHHAAATPTSSTTSSSTSSSTWQDPPSMAAVSNTASRILFSPSLWQRPMVKLVATTAATTLVVTGGLAFWFLGRAPSALPPSTPTSSSPSLVTSTPMLRPINGSDTGGATGPHVRPVRAGEADAPVANSPPAPGPKPTEPTAISPAPPQATTGSAPAGDVDSDDELRSRVRASRLSRLDRAKPARRTKPVAARSSKPVVEQPASPPEADAPPEPRRATPEPNLVDGRHIRTSL